MCVVPRIIDLFKAFRCRKLFIQIDGGDSKALDLNYFWYFLL
jgi:hypothetical protein